MFADGEITKIKQVQTTGEGGSKFWSFCENVITECPQAMFEKKITKFIQNLDPKKAK